MCEPINIDQETEDAEDELFCQEGECSCCEDSIDSEKAVPKWLVSDVHEASIAVWKRAGEKMLPTLDDLKKQWMMAMMADGQGRALPPYDEAVCYGPFGFDGHTERFALDHHDTNNGFLAPRGTWDEVVKLEKCRECVIDTRPPSTQLFHGQLTGTNDAETGTLTDTHAAQVYHDRYQAPRSNEGGIKAGPGGLRVSA